MRYPYFNTKSHCRKYVTRNDLHDQLIKKSQKVKTRAIRLGDQPYSNKRKRDSVCYLELRR